MLESPAAFAPGAMATELSPDAVEVAPIAVAVSPLAFEPIPIAALALPLERAPGPNATEFRPVARAAVPKADAPCTEAVALVPTTVEFGPIEIALPPMAIVPDDAAVEPHPMAISFSVPATVVSVQAGLPPGIFTDCAYASSGALRPATTATAATVSTLSAGIPSKKPSTMPVPMAPLFVPGELTTTLPALLPRAVSSSDTATHAPRASFHTDR